MLKPPEDLSGINVHKEPIEVKHADLEKFCEDSAFKVVCPVCEVGLLLVQRDQETYELLKRDRCILCGQVFVYTDIEDLKKKAREK